MNVWIKRGLQTALLTGGLLALGTGVATADDSHLGVTVEVSDGAAPALVDGSATRPAPPKKDGPVADVDVPVQVSGTALGVLGAAAADGSGRSAASDGGGGSLVDVDVPVTVCGTAVAVVGHASGDCGGSDGGRSDGGGPDGRGPDRGGSDRGGSDRGASDGGVRNSGARDGGAPDGGGSGSEGGSSDGGSPDTGGSGCPGVVVGGGATVTASGRAVVALDDVAGSRAPGGSTHRGPCACSAHPATAQRAGDRPQLVTAGLGGDAGGGDPVVPLVGLALLAAGAALGLLLRRRPSATTTRSGEETQVFVTRRIPRSGRRG